MNYIVNTDLYRPPDMEYAKAVCKMGQGFACCRYLCMAKDGLSCEKHSSLKTLLDLRVVMKSMVARGDNCEGRAARGDTGEALIG